MKKFLVMLLIAIPLFVVACDDKKEDHEDCSCPLAGEIVAGEEIAGEEPVEAGEPVEPQAGEEEPEAGEPAPEGGEVVEPEVPCECEADMMCDC